MQKTIVKHSLRESTEPRDVEFWLSRPVEERIAAVEFLRRQYYGCSQRLQRLARVVQRTRG